MRSARAGSWGSRRCEREGCSALNMETAEGSTGRMGCSVATLHRSHS